MCLNFARHATAILVDFQRYGLHRLAVDTFAYAAPDVVFARGGFQPGDLLLYSKVWNGYYTQREIDYLDEYYARLEEGFVLDNQNLQDYARKAAKASLDADIKYNRMRQGKASVAEWEKAQAIFDNLSKSANFAACKRKPGDMAGLGS